MQAYCKYMQVHAENSKFMRKMQSMRIKLENHRSFLAISLRLYYFCLHGCWRTRIHSPHDPDRQNATFHLLTPIPRKILRSTLLPAVRIATYETDRPDERTASAHQHFGQRSGH